LAGTAVALYNYFECQLSLLLLILTYLVYNKYNNKINLLSLYIKITNFSSTLCDGETAVAPDLEKIRDREMDSNKNQKVASSSSSESMEVSS
jgi:hypothetical protein